MKIEFLSRSSIERNLFNILLIVLLAILYLPLLIYWSDGWLNKTISIEHEYFSHGLIGLPVATYLVWQKRDRWQKLPDNFHILGLIFFSIGIAFYGTGLNELVNLSLPIILTGICLWLKGIPGLKLQAFPLLLTWLATPTSVPYLLTPFTMPLQKFIAGTAGFILMQLGFEVTVEQIYLSVGGKYVEVAPYCAGLKMLFTSLYISLILLYWTNNLKNCQKTSLLLSSAVVISVGANILRNTILAYFHGTGKDQLFTWLHDSWGGDIYSAMMLGTIVLFLNLIDR